MNRNSLTEKLLKELIHYNPDTGIFIWLERDRRWFKTLRAFSMWNTRFPGGAAGAIDRGGYRIIKVLRVFHKAHRLAFLYMDGAFPPEDTDHINGIRDDNRWRNLRAVTRSENMKNTAVHKDNTSGYIGVCWNGARNKWMSRIMVDGKHIHLGLFDELEDAAACRLAATRKYGFHENHGRPSKQTGSRL